MHYPSTIAVFLAARGLLASAAPAVSPVDLLPRDIALLAVDDSGKLVNYGAGGKAVPVGDDVKATNGTTKSAPGAKLGDKKTKRGPASTCVPLTKEDLEKRMYQSYDDSHRIVSDYSLQSPLGRLLKPRLKRIGERGSTDLSLTRRR